MPVPVDLNVLLIVALLNPAVMVVAFWMGTGADQWQKLPLAAFAAAFAGTMVIAAAVWLDVPWLGRIGRGTAGLFIAQLVPGLAWAYAGYRFARRPRP